MSYRYHLIFLCVLLCIAVFSGIAKAKEVDTEVKALSGISIVGNKEAPKSLFIVPWKSSELAVETGLSSKLLNEKLNPVDIEVFERELEFYSATSAK